MSTTQHVSIAGINVDSQLYQFVNEEVLPGSGVDE